MPRASRRLVDGSGALQRGLMRSGEGPSRSNGALDATRRAAGALVRRGRLLSEQEERLLPTKPLLFAVIIVIMRILHRGVLVG